MISDLLLDACNSDLAAKISANNLQTFCECDVSQTIAVGSSYYDLGNFLRIFGSDWHPECIISSIDQLAYGTMFCIENHLCSCHIDEIEYYNQELVRHQGILCANQPYINKSSEYENNQIANECNTDDLSDKKYFLNPKMFDDSYSVINDYFKTKFLGHEGKLVGFYTQKERKNKINHLRSKLMKRKLECPINKVYKGRSKAARTKPRFCGKFVKSDLAEKYAVDDKEVHKRNELIDKYVSMMDYQKTVDVLAEY